MSPAQTKLYWRAWQSAKKAAHLEDADRKRLHLQALGYEASSKNLSNSEFDLVLAAFRAVSAPSSLAPQLRAIDQPRQRLLHRIRDQFSCLALFVEHPAQYLAAILQNRFKVGFQVGSAVPADRSPISNNQFSIPNSQSQPSLSASAHHSGQEGRAQHSLSAGGEGQGEVALEHLLESLRADTYTRPRAQESEAGPAGELISDSELVQIRNTLTRCLSSFRRRGLTLSAGGPAQHSGKEGRSQHSGKEGRSQHSGEEGRSQHSLSAGGEGRGEVVEPMTEHEMCRRAQVDCFRPACAECRDSRAPVNVARELVEEPF